MAKDPVCAMKVDTRTPAATSKYKGQTFYFCTVDCKQEFDQNPEKYIRVPEANSDQKG